MSKNGDEAHLAAPSGPAPSPRGWLDPRALPAWLRPTAHESRIPVALAILVAASLQLLLSQQFTLIHPR